MATVVQKPIYTGPSQSYPAQVPFKPVDIPALAAASPQAALDALSARAMRPVALQAMAGSTEEAMVDRGDEDRSRPAMPGSRRTRKRAQFGVGYNTGVSI